MSDIILKTGKKKVSKHTTLIDNNKKVLIVNENGEVEQELDTTIITENYQEPTDIDWDKIWLQDVLSAIDEIGNRKMKVVMFILNNRDKNNNYLLLTQEEIAEQCGVCRATVNRTIISLKKANLLKGKPGKYIINPDYIARGSHNHRMSILRVYNATSI